MHYRPLIYCNVSFIIKVLNRYKEASIEIIENRDYIDDILSVIKLISSKNVLCLDISDNELKTSANPYIRKLFKTPSITPRCLPEMDVHLKNFDLIKLNNNAIYLLDCEKELAIALEIKLGVLVITPETICQKSAFIKPSAPILLKRNQTDFNWGKMAKFKHLPHSILIIDNYLDSHKERLKDNIIPLFKSLIVSSEHLVPHVTILTIFEHPALIFKTLNDLFTEESIHVELRIVRIEKSQFHDRFLITNQLWLTVGIGFYILKQGSGRGYKYIINRDSTINILPLFCSQENNILINEEDSYYNTAMNIIYRLEKIDEDTQEYIGTEHRSIGIKNQKRMAIMNAETEADTLNHFI